MFHEIVNPPDKKLLRLMTRQR